MKFINAANLIMTNVQFTLSENSKKKKKGYVLPIKHQDQHVRRQNTEKQITTFAGF